MTINSVNINYKIITLLFEDINIKTNNVIMLYNIHVSKGDFIMDYTIRLMKKKDIPQVQHVAQTSWNSTYEGIIPLSIQNNFLKQAYSDRNMKRRLKNTIIYVAEVGGKIVGFANYSRPSIDGSTTLGAIYIYPEYQGKGIGSAFLNEAINKMENLQEIRLNVEKNNLIGMRFYQAKGFEVVNDYKEEFHGHTIHTVNMVLRLKEDGNVKNVRMFR